MIILLFCLIDSLKSMQTLILSKFRLGQ